MNTLLLRIPRTASQRSGLTASSTVFRRYIKTYKSSSDTTAPSSLDHTHDEKTFNESPSLEEFQANQEFDEKITGHEKEFVERNAKGYGSLQEKGERIPEEQERADDFM
jgi:hypothetical protein